MPDQSQSPTQVIELVGRRYEFLAILENDTYDKRTLEEKLDVSRSTVDRALRELETAALVRRTTGGYDTTLYGRTVVAIYDLLLDYVDYVQRAKSLLAALPSEIEFSVGLVIDAEIIVAEEPALHAPSTRIAELVKRASEIRGLAYAHTSPEAMELFQQQVVEEGTPTEIVFREAMYNNFKITSPGIVESLISSKHYEPYVAPDVPFGLFLLNIDGSDRVCLVVYDDEQNLKGIIVNDTDEAVAWGTRLFERYRADAEPVTPDEEQLQSKRR